MCPLVGAEHVGRILLPDAARAVQERRLRIVRTGHEQNDLVDAHLRSATVEKRGQVLLAEHVHPGGDCEVAIEVHAARQFQRSFVMTLK